MAAADTVVACATPWGRGAVAMVRLSGPDARRNVTILSSSVCERNFQDFIASLEPRSRTV